MAQELELLIKLKEEASAQLAQLSANIKANAAEWQSNFGAVKSQLQSAGIMFAGFGAAVMGAFGMSYKAAEDERLVIARLAITLKNLGTNYDDVKSSLNGYIEATIKSTGIARNEQIGALNQLLLTTGNYSRAMELLPLALDLAAAKQMDTSTAALLLGRVAEGNINALHRYGFSMDGVKSAGAALEIIHNKVTGSAQALLSPLQLLTTRMNDVRETIGELIAGPAGKFLSFATDALIKIKEWIKANPELATTLADIGIALGVAAALAGLLALATLGVAATMVILLSPIGLILLGLMGLIMILFGFAFSWKTIWIDIGNFFKWIVNGIIYGIDWVITKINWLIIQINKLSPFKIPGIPVIPYLEYTTLDKPDKPRIDESLGGGTPRVDIFGNYGNLGKTGVVGGQNITINVQGSVISDQDLMNLIRQELIKLQYRNATTGIK